MVALAVEMEPDRDPFRVLFYGNPAAMVISRPETLELIDVNPRWSEMFGYSRAEALGHTAMALGLISTEAASTRITNHRIQSEGYETELALQNREGRPVIVLASARPIVFANQHCIITTLIDITARKQAEQAFDLVFQASPAGMMLVDAATEQNVAINARMLELTGKPLEHFTSQTSAALDMIVSPRRVDLLAQLARTGVLDNIEVCINGARGLAWCLLSTNLVTLANRQYRLSVFTDIDDRKHYESQLRALNSELEKRVERRTQELQLMNRDLEAFSSSVSHDLRAPLRTMHGFSQILLEDFELPDDAREYIESIHASGDRMKQLIEALLAFARLGRATISRSPVDLDAMVSEVADELGGRDIVTVEPLGTANVDPQLVRAVWTNLLDNALKYSRVRPTPMVKVGREQRDGETVYFIEDNGVGFDPAHADRLFGMFQRLHTTSEFEGTGVGLANVRRIVERHRGRITASSQLGKGSRFELTLGRAER